MALEVDAARDASADLGALLPFPSSPEEEREAQAAVLEAYLGPRGAAEALSRHATPPFPGPNPISMDLDAHLPRVQREDYVVSAKVDGTRFQLVCLAREGEAPAVVLLDRTMRCFSPTYFSAAPALFGGGNGNGNGGAGGRGVQAVLDAELAETAAAPGGLQLFVFDAVLLGGSTAISARPYPERWAAAREAVAGAELGFGEHTLIPVRAKPIYPKARAAELMRHPERFLGPGVATDGVVFTPAADPVRTFRHWHMFKVKERHTIDMRLVLVPKQPLRPFSNPILAMPDTIVQRIRSNVLPSGPVSTAAPPRPDSLAAPRASSAARTAASSLLHLLGSRKRLRDEGETPSPAARSPTLPPPAPAPRQGPRAAEAAEVEAEAEAPETASPTQWILRLEYSRGGRVLDATTDGVEYAGHRVVFQVRETPALAALVDGVERVWRRVPGDVMTMSLIAEVALSLRPADLETPDYELAVPVVVERPRPDKDAPNSFVTITRTFTSILYGVRGEQLEALAEAGL
jgi:hypothetical protein